VKTGITTEICSNRYCTKAWVCGRSPAEVMGSKHTEGMDVYFVSVVCCQVEVSAAS
jgi:hypothetical protein